MDLKCETVETNGQKCWQRQLGHCFLYLVPFNIEAEGTKEPLDESEKAGLKLSIQKTKIMASSPITSWQIDRETMETVTDFIFLGSKITSDGDCIHEIQRHLLLRRKAMTNLDKVLKGRDISLLTKVSQPKL